MANGEIELINDSIKRLSIRTSVFEPIKTIRSSIQISENKWCRPVYDYNDFKNGVLTLAETAEFLRYEMIPEVLSTTFNHDFNDALMWLCGQPYPFTRQRQMRELFKLVE